MVHSHFAARAGRAFSRPGAGDSFAQTKGEQLFAFALVGADGIEPPTYAL
jgi:hypothetical protein